MQEFTSEEINTYRVIFNQFDEDGSGKIDIQELRKALWNCGIECSESEVVAMMKSVDDTGDLEIDFDEFITFISIFKGDQGNCSSSSSSESDQSSMVSDEDIHAVNGHAHFSYDDLSSPCQYSDHRGPANQKGVGVFSSELNGFDLQQLHRRRVAVVYQWPESELNIKMQRLRSIREQLLDNMIMSTGDDVDNRKASTAALMALARINCPFVPSGSFLKALQEIHRENEFTRAGTHPAGAMQIVPQPNQVICFVDEVMESVSERLLVTANYTMCYNSDDLYSQAVDAKLTAKKQQDMSRLDASIIQPPDGTKQLQSDDGKNDEPLHLTPLHDVSNNGIYDKYIPEASNTANDTQGSRPDNNNDISDDDARKLERALEDLSSFTFSIKIDSSRNVGSAAFREKVKTFPYYMFPIEPLVERLDALEWVHDQYVNSLRGKEFMLKPRCINGNKCKQLGTLEHQLAYTHPCYSDTIPCPHRHRPLHMVCYHHDEDENPTVEQAMKEAQKRLYILNLSDLEMGDTGTQCIAHVLSRDFAVRGPNEYRVRHLSMGGNQISPVGAAILLDSAVHLVTLDLSNNGLGYKGGAMLAGSSIGPSLQKLLTESQTLVSLNLSRNRLSDRDARYLTEALKVNTSLNILNLQKNELGSLFGPDMSFALQENRDLKEMYLGWNRLGSAGTNILLNEMKTSSTLEVVDLSWTGVTDEGAEMLAEMIIGSQLLKSLSLAHNSITGKGITVLSKPISACRSLIHFDISFNSLGTEATRNFLIDLVDNLVLESLDIRCVKAGDEVLNEIKNYIKLRASHGFSPHIQFGISAGSTSSPMEPLKSDKL